MAFANRVDAVRGATDETEVETEEESGAAATLAHTNAMRCRVDRTGLFPVSGFFWWWCRVGRVLMKWIGSDRIGICWLVGRSLVEDDDRLCSFRLGCACKQQAERGRYRQMIGDVYSIGYSVRQR